MISAHGKPNFSSQCLTGWSGIGGMKCAIKFLIQKGQGRYPSIHSMSHSASSISSVCWSTHQQETLCCFIFKVAADWSAKLWSLLWSIHKDLAFRNINTFSLILIEPKCETLYCSHCWLKIKFVESVHHPECKFMGVNVPHL